PPPGGGTAPGGTTPAAGTAPAGASAASGTSPTGVSPGVGAPSGGISPSTGVCTVGASAADWAAGGSWAGCADSGDWFSSDIAAPALWAAWFAAATIRVRANTEQILCFGQETPNELLTEWRSRAEQ